MKSSTLIDLKRQTAAYCWSRLPIVFAGKPIDTKSVTAHGNSFARRTAGHPGVIPRNHTPAWMRLYFTCAYWPLRLLNYVHKSMLVLLSWETKNDWISQLFKAMRGVCAEHTNLSDVSPFSMRDFRIKPYLMDHSALTLRRLNNGDGKTVLFTGDFRGHGHKRLVWQFLTAGSSRGGTRC
jgi:hypothetical protein